MRACAIAAGAAFRCESLKVIEELTVDKLHEWSQGSTTSTNNLNNTWIQQSSLSSLSLSTNKNRHHQCKACNGQHQNLLVIPMECNFGGTRPNIKRIQKVIKSCPNWSLMLDIAKAASTGPVNLRKMDIDFACLSFYKLFGEPTGLGGLFVKRKSTHILQPKYHQTNNDYYNGSCTRYFGGGSVDVVLSKRDFCVLRSEPSPLSSLKSGTMHFRGIVSLQYGLHELQSLGGMVCIQQHTSSLATELCQRLKMLRHGNGQLVVIFYGPWNNINEIIVHEKSNDKNNNNLPGPTITFNVLHNDGSFVGYNEISKLAALNSPPIQLRTGCFCNPGACQQALELTDNEIIHNYETMGHICGDNIDIIHGKPTGAVRASIGKDTIWEDIDALVTFIERVFVNNKQEEKSNNDKDHHHNDPNKQANVTISELYIYPIKSCAAQQVSQWKLDFPSGKLEFDREFALVDSFGTAMRLQSYPKMGFIRPCIDLSSNIMTVSAPGCQDLVINLESDNCCNNNHNDGDDDDDDVVKICGNKCGGKVWGDYTTSLWFSSYLGVSCWLARYSESSLSIISNERQGKVAFVNEQPLLLVTESSVQQLNHVMKSSKFHNNNSKNKNNMKTVQSRQFRPNIVAKQSSNVQSPSRLHFEDFWQTIRLKRNNFTDNTISFNILGPCARCSMVDYDPDSCQNTKTTFKALAQYRQWKGQITFGIFLRAVKLRTTNTTEHDDDADNINIDINNVGAILKQGDVLICN